MSGDRTSWLSKEAKVNGLFAAHLPRRRRSKVLPTSHADGNKKKDLESELEAYKSIINEESRMKDKLMESLSKRCSEAEAKVEQVLMEKARVERELAAVKFEIDEREQSERQLNDAQAATAEAQARSAEHESRARALESELANVSHELSRVSQAAAQQLRDREVKIGMLEQSLSQHKAELTQLAERYQADLASLQERQQETEQSEQAQQQLGDRCDELEAHNSQLAQQLQALLAENRQLKQANTQIVDRLEHGEASLESTRKKAEGNASIIKEKERLLREAEARHAEAEAKAERLADQLKASNKKAVFLVKKAEAFQAKFSDKEKEALQLKDKLEDLGKKYRLTKERLDYVKHSAGGPGCSVPSAFSGNNNHDEDNGEGPNVVPGLARRSGLSVGRASKTPTCRVQTGQERHEDHPRKQASATNAAAAAVARMPDPAMAPDSDAPDWMKF